MHYILKRDLDILGQISRKSLFLFGPRATGKTSLIKEELDSKAYIIDLLKSKFYLPLSQNPSLLADMIRGQDKKIIVVDEIQKLPELLDEIHALIEESEFIFLLTGSSARRLKRQNANMLGGRASKCMLFPLTWNELNRKELFKLDFVLRYGSLPRVYFSNSPEDELFDYVDVYLKEEILAEAAVRNLPAFSRFLKVASLYSGEILNYSNIASDIGLSANTIREYFSILDDTLLGFQLPAWQNANNRKSISKAKHYFFDCGVLNTLSGTKTIDRNSNLYGKCFEHFIIQEVRAYNEYLRKRWNLSHWRSNTGIEVDLIIENSIAIEIKSTQKITSKMLKGLKAIQSEGKFTSNFLISQDDITKRSIDGITQIHWVEFLKKLWNGEFDSLIH